MIKLCELNITIYELFMQKNILKTKTDFKIPNNMFIQMQYLQEPVINIIKELFNAKSRYIHDHLTGTGHLCWPGGHRF